MNVPSLAPTAPAVASFPRRPVAPSTFANPVAVGADPWVIYHEGWYYWCLSVNMRGVAIHRSPTLTQLGELVSLWYPPAAGPHCAEIWAPELHRLDGRWYVYVAASDGNNATHRMIVLEVEGAHPTGEIQFKAELYTGDDIRGRTHNRWAIDGTVLAHGGRRYLLWSGWADERDEQWLYIAELLNPWTVSSNRVRMCANDDFVWERVGELPSGRGLNEGPQVLQRHGRVFVVFSASGSWEASYKLGILELRPGGDPLTARDWIKSPEPVLAATERTWGVGHCSFTQSADGAEDWIAFHAKVERAHNWNRVIHVQPFFWDATGRPLFDRPRAAGETLVAPSTSEAPAPEALQVAAG
jgi:GH43 family beta-xylosidase